MTRAEFLEEIKSLEAFFEKELSIEQATDWYEELQDYSIAKFRVAIRESKRNCKFMPKLSEFLIFIQEARVEKQETEKVECSKCNGTGYIAYIKKVLNGNKILEYTYCCTCDCSNATAYDGSILNQNKNKYRIPSKEELISEGYEEVYAKQKEDVLLRLEKNLWR